MRRFSIQSSSLLWRIVLSSSLAVTAVFALTGWMVQSYATSVSQRSLEEEVRTSLQAYDSLWRARVFHLAEISRVMSSMSDVRAAFMTDDRATIRDTAEQLWSQISSQGATFLVLDPTGNVLTSLGGDQRFSIDPALLRSARKQFPKQVSGYSRLGNKLNYSDLYYFVLTPVYVQSEHDPALLNVLLIAFHIDNALASELKVSTNGTDFAFVSGGRIAAATLPGITAQDLRSKESARGAVRRITWHNQDYLLLPTGLRDTLGNPIGDLYLFRSFARPEATLVGLRRTVTAFWTAGLLVALCLSYLLARRVLEPVRKLDRAAEEVTRRNYGYRVPVETNDELGRLAIAFNQMCDSIQAAREDLIRQEQINTIGRFSSSIVHDLRNPLAAIYGGAEMLVDAQLSSEHQRRLAANIYSSSRRIQELLQQLVEVSRAKTKPLEVCKLAEIVSFARDTLLAQAEASSVTITLEIPADIQILVLHDRLERVFINLLDNAIDAMPSGGNIHVSAHTTVDEVIAVVRDTGPGIAPEALSNLFHPFASFGKKNGLGLGLALSRQALLDVGGDLRVDSAARPGATFQVIFPIYHDSSPHSPSAQSRQTFTFPEHV